MKTPLVLVGSITLALAPLAGLAATPTTPYEINVILPVTGGGAFIAKADMNALTVIEQTVNAAGGIRGRTIKFVVQDDQSNPAVGVQLLNGVLAKKVPFILGSTLGATCGAMTPLLKDGPVEYCFSPSISPAPGGYVYSAGVGAGDLVAAMAHYLRERGLKKIAVLTSTDTTGQDADRAIDNAMAAPENSSLSIVSRDHFNPTDVSIAGQMTHITASGADVLIAWTTGTPFATVLRGVRDSGLAIPVVTTNGNMSYAQMRQYKNIMPKELLFPGLPSFGPDKLPNGKLKNAVNRFLTAFKATGIQPEAGENQVWDPTLIVLDAVKKFGFDVTAAQVRDYINNLHDWTGIYGTFDFHAIPQRGVGIDAVIVQRWDPVKEAWTGVSKPGGSPLK
jgi:branched-chain amino acid transport system substrate-binding protein